MSESCFEQHPLLSEDFPEDHYSPRYQRRLRPMAFRSRSRCNAKGAAAIIKRWPDYWSTAVIYWWMGLGMFAITILIIYNGVLAFALLPSEISPMPGIRTATSVEKDSSNHVSSLPKVFMHTFVNSTEGLSKYLPLIQTISQKYTSYEYHLIIVVNDIHENNLSAEENNEIALNSLLRTPNTIGNINDFVIEEVSLTKIMNDSPLKKFWRNIPLQFIEFLVRAISVWDKGGIAFNPSILLPHSFHGKYIDKVHDILRKYENKSIKHNFTVNKNEKGYNNTKNIKRTNAKLNNIRDIIDAMEINENMAFNNEDSLTETDNKIMPAKHTSNKNNLNNITHSNQIPNTNAAVQDMKNFIEPTVNNNGNQELLMMAESKLDSTSSNLSFLPMFFNFLFNEETFGNNSKTVTNGDSKTSKPVLVRKRKSIIPTKHQNVSNNLTMVHAKNETAGNETRKYRPMIISTRPPKNFVDYVNKSDEFKYYDREDQLIIDLKGNILVTKISCHAFIGSVFSNIMHHSQDETVTDLIISELSFFCKGLLSSCSGIDVLLL